MMRPTERAERIRALVESFGADKVERARLKEQADQTLALLHRAVREFVGEADVRERATTAHR
jgi:hypothetical protein